MEIWERRQHGDSLVGPQLHYQRVRSNKGVPVLEAPEKEHCRGQVGSKPTQLSNHPGFSGTEPPLLPTSWFSSVWPDSGHAQDLGTWLLFNCPGQL